MKLIVHKRQTTSERGVVKSSDPLKFLEPNHISGTAEARVVQFWVQQNSDEKRKNSGFFVIVVAEYNSQQISRTDPVMF